MEGAIAASSCPFPFSGGILLSLGYDLTGTALPSQRASICKSRFSNNAALVLTMARMVADCGEDIHRFVEKPEICLYQQS